MIAIAFLFVRMLCDCFKSRRQLKAENPGASDGHPGPADVISLALAERIC